MVSVSSRKRIESSSTVHEILKGKLLERTLKGDLKIRIKSEHNNCMFYDPERQKNEFQIEMCDATKQDNIFKLEFS